MNILGRVNSFFKQNGALGSDFTSNAELKSAAVGAGVLALGTAVGYGIGSKYGTDHFTPTQQIPVDRTYFVKTGTEIYNGTCYGHTPNGDSFSFTCPKVRDTGYYQHYTENVNAQTHYALMGLGFGALAGFGGGVVASLGTYALLQSL